MFQYCGSFEHLRLGFYKNPKSFEKINNLLKNYSKWLIFMYLTHEAFWHYLSRLNDYRGQYVHLENMQCCA